MPGLRSLAEQDLGAILEDGVTGWAWDITITDPLGATAALKGFSNDISQMVDPGTGLLVHGRTASVAIRISSLAASGLAIPRGIPDRSSPPWRVSFSGLDGTPYEFKVRQSDPDLSLGVVVCILEVYVP